jgi:hypothetical protein
MNSNDPDSCAEVLRTSPLLITNCASLAFNPTLSRVREANIFVVLVRKCLTEACWLKSAKNRQ